MNILNSYISDDKSCCQFTVQAFLKSMEPDVKLAHIEITERHKAAGRQILKESGLNPSEYKLIDLMTSPPNSGGLFWGQRNYEICYSFERLE